MQRVSLLGVLAVLSTVSFASDEKTPATPAGTETTETATETAGERGLPAAFSWADFDGDGRLDLAAVSGDGKLQLLANAGEGRFEDVTAQVGLSGTEDVALALWGDYDNDSRLDLFVGPCEGKSRLFRNEGGGFLDMTEGSGLLVEVAVESAHWFDNDGDGRLDLHVVTVEKNELFRGLEGGFFERSELPLAELTSAPRSGGSRADTPDAGKDADKLGALSAPGSRHESGGEESAVGSKTGSVSLDESNVPVGRNSSGPPPRSVTPLGSFPFACASAIRDQTNPGSCLEASSTPTLGRLYPISTNLFVAVGGNVGIGTTTPAAKLQVAGTARITGTLTLAPEGDQALDVSTGSIYKGGTLFLHTKGSAGNTAIGREALSQVTLGINNTATGDGALRSTTDSFNTAFGYHALFSNTSGDNTAIGSLALQANTTGIRNTASGDRALRRNTTGFSNTADGYAALFCQHDRS